MQYALAANGIFSGWDLSILGDIYQDQGYLDSTEALPCCDTAASTWPERRAMSRFGNWLLKSEFAYLRRAQVQRAALGSNAIAPISLSESSTAISTIPPFGVERVRRLSGFNRDFTAAGYARNQWQTALRHQGSFCTPG